MIMAAIMYLWLIETRSCLAEHYTFPDQQPAEDQHEVRTIEEATLFRVAFPEVVEKYLEDKSMAEGKKTKSKKHVINPCFVH